MTDDNELALDQEALERAAEASWCCGPSFIPWAEALASTAPIHDVAIACRAETEAAIRAYLRAIRYPQQRAVVEAAKTWADPAKQYASPSVVAAVDARLNAAVAALEDRTDGR